MKTQQNDSVESPHNTTDTLTRTDDATCNICCRRASNPWRVYDEQGKVTEGCVSSFHTGHLIEISESNRWHMRKEAKAIRRNLAAIKFHRMRAPYI